MSNYYGGLQFYWVTDSGYDGITTDATTNTAIYDYEYIHPSEIVDSEPEPSACDYCGVGVEDDKRVTCRQCGAPLRTGDRG